MAHAYEIPLPASPAGSVAHFDPRFTSRQAGDDCQLANATPQQPGPVPVLSRTQRLASGSPGDGISLPAVVTLTPRTFSHSIALPSTMPQSGDGANGDNAKPAPQAVPTVPSFPWEETLEKRYPLPDPSKFTEYERKYPPDKYGEEMGPNARYFKMYRDRVTEQDEDLIGGWNDTLNVLLVFAGLFSAVLTAFLVESSKRLRQDFTETAAEALVAILAHLQGTRR
ncbi:hypothetical protein BKA62DRAFT_712955 [Auriculariales sp. MPI-PUGE-AT-0066]|nr:hypothetical protein BKA62DRAFT_712955 [Auriculariales sp. MPI-PUGE-AT-0066]